jgi:hypothetical protein
MTHEILYSMNFEEHNKQMAIENERRQLEKEKLQGVQISTRASQHATKEELKKAHKIALKMAKERGAKLSPIQEEELVNGLD